MTFRETFGNDLFAVFYDADEFAEPASYNGASILVVEDGGRYQTTSVPGVLVPGLSIRILSADVPHPRPGDQVVLRGATWHVASPPVSEGGEWLLELDRETRHISV